MKLLLTNGLASRATSTTGAGLDAVFLEVGVIGMRRTGEQIGLGVVVRTLILVLDQKTDGSAESNTVLNAGLNEDLVLLVTLRTPVG